MRTETDTLIPKFRVPSRRERLADGCVHVSGVAGALYGAVVLVSLTAEHGSNSKLIAVSIYAVGLLAMLGCSAAYNLCSHAPRREILRRFDHAAIFVMIAASYTPWTTKSVDAEWSSLLAILLWTLALTGAAVKILLPRRFERLSIVVYIVLGWLGIVAFAPVIDVIPSDALVLWVSGGAIYTVGVVFHLWDSLPYQNAIWHALVAIGAGVHYLAIMDGVVHFG